MIDVIILSDSKNEKLKEITSNCINSLFESENNLQFNVIVVESNHSIYWDNCTTLHFDEPFHYNKYMNKAAMYCANERIVFCNNDLIFHKGWATELMNWDFQSMSPRCPINPLQLEMKSINLGYETSKHISGWCIWMQRKLFDFIEGFDEDFKFWCADDSYREQLKYHNINHYLIGTSLVTHLGSQTLKTLDSNTNKEYTTEQMKKYKIKFK